MRSRAYHNCIQLSHLIKELFLYNADCANMEVIPMPPETKKERIKTYINSRSMAT